MDQTRGCEQADCLFATLKGKLLIVGEFFTAIERPTGALLVAKPHTSFFRLPGMALVEFAWLVKQLDSLLGCDESSPNPFDGRSIVINGGSYSTVPGHGHAHYYSYRCLPDRVKELGAVGMNKYPDKLDECLQQLAAAQLRH